MSDLHDLIRACKSHPDDDAPRLVLADWLEDRGEEDRAAFIRRQVAAPEERARGHDVSADWSGAWRRWADAWQQENEGWVYPLHWQRGFLRAGDYYRELYDSLPAILQPPFDWTWVEEIRFSSWHDGDWSPLFRSPRLLELNRLEFSDDAYRSNLVRPLAACPFVANLRHLRLYDVNLGDDGLRRLSQSRPLCGLRSLELLYSGVGRRGARAFAESEVWDGLQSCSFEGNRLGDSALAELAWGRVRPRLQSLDISLGRYSDGGLLRLSRSDRFPALRELSIGHADPEADRPRLAFGRFGIESLLGSPVMPLNRVVISIVSRHPVPAEIEETVRDHPDRLTLHYKDLSPPRGV